AVSQSCFVSVTSGVFPAAFPVTLPERTLETPTAYEYSGTFEQQLSKGLVLSVAYVGTQGRHLLRQTTPNFGPNALAFVEDFFGGGNVPQVFGFFSNPGSRYVGPPPGTSTGGRPVKNIGGVTLFTSDANSRYHAFQAQVRGNLVLFKTNNEFQVA